MANSNSIVKGQELMVFMGGKSIAWATSHSLNVTAATGDISTKDHGFFAATNLTSISWEITSENLYTDDGYNALYKAMAITREPVEIVFGHYSDSTDLATSGIADSETESWTAPSGSSTVYYTGNAYITSLTANAANGDNATFSVTFSGVGQLAQMNYSA